MPIRQTFERLFPEPAVRSWLPVLALLFALSVPAGYHASHPELREVAKTVSELAKSGGEIAGGSLFLLILLNNVFASLLLLITGLLGGVIPVLSVAFNGFALGLIYSHVSGTEGAGHAALGIVPPAIFEIPALLITASYGVHLGIGVIRRFRGKEAPPMSEQVNRAFERYFTLVFPLLIAAAAMETFLALQGY